MEQEQQEQEALPTFADIEKEVAYSQSQSQDTKEDLTTDDKSSNIVPEQNKETDVNSFPIPETWFEDGVPRSLKNIGDYQQWFSGQNKLRGAQGKEFGDLKRRLEEIERRPQTPQREYTNQPDPVDIESLYQERLSTKPVETIAEITNRIVKHNLEQEFKKLRSEYDARLSKSDLFISQQEAKNMRGQFLEQTKLEPKEEAKLVEIINSRAEKYQSEFTRSDGSTDLQGVLDDAYGRYKASKYDEMIAGQAKQEQKQEQNRTRAVVAPGNGKPPPPPKEIDDMDEDELHALIKKRVPYQ